MDAARARFDDTKQLRRRPGQELPSLAPRIVVPGPVELALGLAQFPVNPIEVRAPLRPEQIPVIVGGLAGKIRNARRGQGDQDRENFWE